nr:MAG TPA: hypothetical protein [Caudoviricetes sp.]
MANILVVITDTKILAPIISILLHLLSCICL